MTDIQFKKLYESAIKINNKDEFINQYLFSYELLEEKDKKNDTIFYELDMIWEAAHRDINDILECIPVKGRTSKSSKLKRLAERYAIPYRTMEKWCNYDRKPPSYVLLMIQICEGLLIVNRE